MAEPAFLSREKVIQLHRISLERQGGMDGLRDPGLLDSALMQPEAAYYYAQGDLAAIAAAYPFTSPRTSRSSTATSARP